MREAALFKSVIDKQTTGARWEGKLSVLTGLSRGIIPSPRASIFTCVLLRIKPMFTGRQWKKKARTFIVPFSLSHTWWNKNKESERNLIEKVGQAKTKGVQSWSSLLYKILFLIENPDQFGLRVFICCYYKTTFEIILMDSGEKS